MCSLLANIYCFCTFYKRESSTLIKYLWHIKINQLETHKTSHYQPYKNSWSNVKDVGNSLRCLLSCQQSPCQLEYQRLFQLGNIHLTATQNRGKSDLIHIIYVQLWILGHKQLLLQFNIKDFVLILECWRLNVKQWMIYDFEKIFAKNMYIEIYIFIIDNDNMNKE